MTAALRRFARAWALPLILLFGLGLRLINLQAEPLWGDEILSWDIVLRFWDSVPTLLEYLKQVEIHPPLYYLFLRGWLALAGQTELALRLPSLIFGLGTIAATWGLARAMFDRRTAAIAALIVAVLPLQIEFSQEARPYAMTCALAAFAWWCLWSYRQSCRPIHAAGYALAQSAAILLHYSALFTLVPAALWWLIEGLRAKQEERRALLRAWFAAHAFVFLAFAWWLDAFVFKLMLGRTPLAGLPPRVDTDLVPLDFFERLVPQVIWASKLKSLPKIEIGAQMLFKLAASIAAFGLLRAGGKTGRPGTSGFLAWMAAGPVILYFLSPQSFEYAPLYERHALFLTIPLAIVFALLFARLRPRHGAALGLLFAATLLPRLADMAGNDGVWDRFHQVRAAAETVNDGYQTGDLVLIWSSISRSNFNHYLRADIEAVPVVPVAYRGRDVWNSRQTLGLLENEYQLRLAPIDEKAAAKKIAELAATSGARRVWLYGVSPMYRPGAESAFPGEAWRHAIMATEPLFPLDLYVRKTE